MSNLDEQRHEAAVSADPRESSKDQLVADEDAALLVSSICE